MSPLISRLFSLRITQITLIAFLLVSAASLVYADGLEFQISGVDDIELGTWDAASDVSGNDSVCIYKNDPADDSYQVTATDNSTITAGEFRLENIEGTGEIPYEPKWGNTADPGRALLQDGVALAASGAHATSASCEGGNNANFSLQIRAQDLMAVPAGTYRATVRLDVGS
jgi:hypothetical protein